MIRKEKGGSKGFWSVFRSPKGTEKDYKSETEQDRENSEPVSSLLPLVMEEPTQLVVSPISEKVQFMSAEGNDHSSGSDHDDDSSNDSRLERLMQNCVPDDQGHLYGVEGATGESSPSTFPDERIFEKPVVVESPPPTTPSRASSSMAYNPFTQHNFSPGPPPPDTPPRLGISMWMKSMRPSSHSYFKQDGETVDVNDNASDTGSNVSIDSAEALELRAMEIRSEIRNSEMMELAQEAERAADAGEERFAGRASTFGDDMDIGRNLKPKKLIRHRTYSLSMSEGQSMLRARSLLRSHIEPKIGVLALRNVDEVIPPFEELQSHLRTHFASRGVDQRTLIDITSISNEIDAKKKTDPNESSHKDLFRSFSKWVAHPPSNRSEPEKMYTLPHDERQIPPRMPGLLSSWSRFDEVLAAPSDEKLSRAENYGGMSQNSLLANDTVDEVPAVPLVASTEIGMTLADHLHTPNKPVQISQKISPLHIPQGLLLPNCFDKKPDERKAEDSAESETPVTDPFPNVADQVQNSETPFDADESDIADSPTRQLSSKDTLLPDNDLIRSSSPQEFLTPVRLKGIKKGILPSEEKIAQAWIANNPASSALKDPFPTPVTPVRSQSGVSCINDLGFPLPFVDGLSGSPDTRKLQPRSPLPMKLRPRSPQEHTLDHESMISKPVEEIIGTAECVTENHDVEQSPQRSEQNESLLQEQKRDDEPDARDEEKQMSLSSSFESNLPNQRDVAKTTLNRSIKSRVSRGDEIRSSPLSTGNLDVSLVVEEKNVVAGGGVEAALGVDDVSCEFFGSSRLFKKENSPQTPRRIMSWPRLDEALVVSAASEERPCSPVSSPGGNKNSKHSRRTASEAGSGTSFSAAVEAIMSLGPKPGSHRETNRTEISPYLSSQENHAFLNNYLYCSKLEVEHEPKPDKDVKGPFAGLCDHPCGNMNVDLTCGALSGVLTDGETKAYGGTTKPETWYEVASEKFDDALERLVGSGDTDSSWRMFQAPRLRKKSFDSTPTSLRKAPQPKGIVLVKTESTSSTTQDSKEALSEREFKNLYGMSRSDFASLPVTERSRLHDEMMRQGHLRRSSSQGYAS